MKVDLQLLGAITRDLKLATKMIYGAAESFHPDVDFAIAQNAITRIQERMVHLLAPENVVVGPGFQDLIQKLRDSGSPQVSNTTLYKDGRLVDSLAALVDDGDQDPADPEAEAAAVADETVVEIEGAGMLADSLKKAAVEVVADEVQKFAELQLNRLPPMRKPGTAGPSTDPAPAPKKARSAPAPKPGTGNHYVEPIEKNTGRFDPILRLLEKRPLSSGDVHKALESSSGKKLTTGSVYQALSELRTKGILETREDPADGQRKNFLVSLSDD